MQTYDGIIWGVAGPLTDPNHAPRQRRDHRMLHPDPTDPPDGGWYPYELYELFVAGHQHFEGDPTVFWYGMPVSVSTCTVAELAEDGDYGVENAREVWDAFREACVRDTGHDPGPGELLAVHHNGRCAHHRPVRQAVPSAAAPVRSVGARGVVVHTTVEGRASEIDATARWQNVWGAYGEEVWNFAAYRRDITSGSVGWLSYLANGLCGEASELADAESDDERRSELADVIWHVATIEREAGVAAAWPFGAPAPSAHGAVYDLLVAAGRVAECLKRPIRGRALDASRLQRAMDACAAAVHAVAFDLCGGVEPVIGASLTKIRGEFGGRPWSAELLAQRDADRGVHRLYSYSGEE